MGLNIAVQMDPIQRINIKGDSTVALLLEGHKRGHALSYYTPDRLALLNGRVFSMVEPLSVRDQAGNVKSSTQLMHELADVFAKMPYGPKKLALANALLKDSQGKLIPFLNGGSKSMREAAAEAVALGLVDEQLARDSDTFNNELKKTTAAVTGVGNAIGTGLLPAINAFMPGLRAWIAANRELIATTARDLVEGLRDVVAVVAEDAVFLAEVFNRNGDVVGHFSL